MSSGEANAQSVAALLGGAPLLLLAVDSHGRITLAAGKHAAAALGEAGPVEGLLLCERPHAATIVKDLVARALAGSPGVGRLALPGDVLQLQVTPVFDATGACSGVVAIGIREVPQASSDEAFMRLFQASPIPIAISSLEGGVFSHCNDAFVQTFKYPRDEVVGRGSVELGMWSPEQRARAIGELREKGVLRNHESGVRTKDGDIRDMIFAMERIEFAGRTHLVGFFFDITERKRAEAELRRLYEQLKELDQLKGQLIANVSHELRTPLTLILGLSERLISVDSDAASRQRDLAAVHRNALGLLRQVNDLLDVARLDAGHVAASYGKVDVAQILRLVASPFDVIASERAIAFTVEAPESLVAEVDAEKLERIAVNLLSNAFKYTPREGRVRCTLAAEGDRLVLRVADNGPGIAPEHRTRVFERFFQVEGGATRRYGGTGLGLAIVREFAEVQGGTARVEAAPGGGALFEIELPLRAPLGAHVDTGESGQGEAAARLAVSELKPVEVSQDPRDDPRDRRALVLVVEDNHEMRRFIVDSLQSDWRIVSAADGVEGLALAIAQRPDLVVSDVMMPRMSGDQLVRELRSRRELDDMRVILLTAKADEQLRVRMLREGAHDFVTKPFSVAELRARVANQVAIKQASDSLQVDLTRKSDEAEELARQLRHAQKMEAIGRLAGGIAHDFNNLLTVIGGYASLLLETQPARELASELAGEIKLASDKAAELTRQLLAFSRRQMLQLQVVDLNALVSGLERMLRRLIGEDISLVTHLAPGLGRVKADPGQLDQVIINLVVNSRDAMPDGGRLTLETGEVVLDESLARALPDIAPGTYVVLTVSDTGSGMSEEVKQRVFEPFFTTKEVGKGTGLGLATVYGIIKQTGGHIGFQSELGRGCDFTVYLPRVEADDVREPRGLAEVRAVSGDEVVLLVEDDAMVRVFTRKALERLGYEVIEASDGNEALEALQRRQRPVDVVVTDIVMPLMGGRELAQRVLERWPGTPLLFVSGYSDDAILRRGVLDQGAHFLQKPFTAAALARALRRALDSGADDER